MRKTKERWIELIAEDIEERNVKGIDQRTETLEETASKTVTSLMTGTNIV